MEQRNVYEPPRAAVSDQVVPSSPSEPVISALSKGQSIYWYVLCTVAWILNEHGRRIFSMSLRLFTAEGFSDGQLAALGGTSVFGIVILSTIAIAAATDSYSRKWMLAAATALSGVGQLAQSISATFATLQIAQLTSALSLSLLLPLIVSVTADIFAPKWRGLALGGLLALGALSQNFTGIVSSFFQSIANYESAAGVSAVLWAALFIAAAFTVREPSRGTTWNLDNTSSLSWSDAALLAAALTIFSVTFMGVSSFSSTYLSREGYPFKDIGLTMALTVLTKNAFGYAAGGIVGGVLALKRPSMVAAFITGAPILAIVGVTKGLFAKDLSSAASGLSWVQFSVGASFSAALITIAICGRSRIRGRLAALVFTGYALGPIFGGLLVGISSDIYRRAVGEDGLAHAIRFAAWLSLFGLLPLGTFAWRRWSRERQS